MTFRLVVAHLQGPGQSRVRPFACCVGSLLSVGRCCARPCPSWCGSRVLCVCVAPPPVCWRSWVPLSRTPSCPTRLPPRTRSSHLRMTWTVPCAVGCSRPCCHPRGGHLPAPPPPGTYICMYSPSVMTAIAVAACACHLRSLETTKDQQQSNTSFGTDVHKPNKLSVSPKAVAVV